jgi:excinuclease ABC subunit C
MPLPADGDHPLVPLLPSVPHAPGCYLYKRKGGTTAGKGVAQGKAEILYVGKAKDLRKRVSQYFQRAVDQKTQAMLEEADHLEWIITKNEVDALILEARLVRQHQPRFNIDLKDDKRYAYLQLTDEEYPRLITARNQDGPAMNRIGPFTDGTERMHLAAKTRKLFRLRVCSTMPKRVCLYYHLNQCSGPCEGKIGKEAYQADVGRARMFLKGQAPALVKELEGEMLRASKEQRYEEAKRLRDSISAIQHTSSKVIVREKRYDEDIVLCRRQPERWLFLVMHVQKGMITGSEEFLLPQSRVDPEAPIDDFLKHYYGQRSDAVFPPTADGPATSRPSAVPIPETIILEQPLADPTINEYFRALAGHEIMIGVPQGSARALLSLAITNIESRIAKSHHVLLALQDALRLPALPRRIDAFDNSHIQGTDVVGACIQFLDAMPHKAGYQRFIVKKQTNDDFAAMQECVTRRYASLLRTKQPLPDLILIDGGKGQLHAAMAGMQACGLAIPMIGLAKREEEVYVPGLPIPLNLDPKSEEGLFLQRVRNEVHRFVITFHRSRRTKTQQASVLDSVPGIGDATKFKLLHAFGSIDGVRGASDEELRKHVSARQLAALRENLR